MQNFCYIFPRGYKDVTLNTPTYLWVLGDIADTWCHCFVLTTQGKVKGVIVAATFGCKTGPRLQRMESGMGNTDRNFEGNVVMYKMLTKMLRHKYFCLLIIKWAHNFHTIINITYIVSSQTTWISIDLQTICTDNHVVLPCEIDHFVFPKYIMFVKSMR